MSTTKPARRTPMVQSPEYPDLRWMPPRSWTNADRSSVQLVVIHTTEGSSTASSAEDGAAYDQQRTDGTSTHYFHDSDSTVQCVHTADQAHTARTQGNRRGIHHELCGRAGWSAATWAGTYAQAMLRNAARQAARDARKWDIPVRHLTAAQVADGVKGFCGHWDITRAFPQDAGTHTDPGGNFPWSQFLDMVRDEIEGDMTKDEMLALLTSAEGKAAIQDAVWTADVDTGDGDYSARGALLDANRRGATVANIQMPALTAMVKALAAKDAVDEQALAAALGPVIGAFVVSQLPQGADQISQDEVTTAVKAALRDAFAA